VTSSSRPGATLEELIRQLRDDDWVALADAHWSAGELCLSFRISSSRGGALRAVWHVTCEAPVELKICDADGGGINVFSRDHPALQHYTDPHGALYLNGAATVQAHAVGVLLLAHAQACDDWIDPAASFGTLAELADALASGRRAIARAPRFLLESYQAALAEHGIASNLVYDGGRRLERKLRLVHFGNSFVVCERLRVEVVSG
jgi:hypothetical protein